MNGLRSLSFKKNVCSSVQLIKQFRYHSTTPNKPDGKEDGKDCDKTNAMAKKLRAKTPIGKLDELEVGKHPYQEKEPLQPWPDNTNPKTGEINGPKGPEPTRYGDWERKGRVSDF